VRNDLLQSYNRRAWRQARSLCGAVALFVAIFWGVLFAQGWFHTEAAKANSPSYPVVQNQQSAGATIDSANAPQIIAQQEDSAGGERPNAEEVEARLKAVLPIVLGASLFGYVFFSFTLMKIGDKAGVQNSWLAWIPVGNLWVMCRAAGKPGWWLILLFVPLVNIVIFFLIIFGIPINLGKSGLLGLLIFVPVIGIFLYYGILAFT
jgi:hypothetical protein